jgi:hypothetical protein
MTLNKSLLINVTLFQDMNESADDLLSNLFATYNLNTESENKEVIIIKIHC